MEDEIHKAVDVAYAGIKSALYGLRGIQENIQKAQGMAQATEASDCEFKYAKIAGQFTASIDIIRLTVEIIEAKLEDAESAVRNIKGGCND